MFVVSTQVVELKPDIFELPRQVKEHNYAINIANDTYKNVTVKLYVFASAIANRGNTRSHFRKLLNDRMTFGLDISS